MVRTIGLFLPDVLCIVDGHGLQGFILPIAVQQHPALQAIDTALAVQAPGQWLVVEHRAETGVQAEQRRGIGHPIVEQQQWVQVLLARSVARQFGNGRFAHHVAQLQAQPQFRLTTHFGQHFKHP